MYPDRTAGIGLMAALFLVVVIGLLVVAITRTVLTGAEASAQDVLSQRALLAAESGSQLGLNRVFPPLGASSCGSWVWDLSNFGLPSCTASVDCRSELVGTENHYTLESDGRCTAGGDAAERSVLVRAR